MAKESFGSRSREGPASEQPFSSDALPSRFYYRDLPGKRIARAETHLSPPVIVELVQVQHAVDAVELPALDMHALFIVLQGELQGEYVIDDADRANTVSLQPGTIVFLKSQTVSTWSLPEDDLFFLICYIPPVQVYKTASEHGMTSRRLRMKDVFIGEDSVLRHLAESVKHVLTEDNSGLHATFITPTARAIILRLYLKHNITSHPLDTATSMLSADLRRQLQEYVQAHLDGAITVKDLAEAVDMSPSHLSRLFREVTPLTPYQYVLLERINKAQTLLSETDASIVEIALQTGFSNQSHLTRRFRIVTGTTPAAYRRAMKE